MLLPVSQADIRYKLYIQGWASHPEALPIGELMSSEEYDILQFKRLLATMFFKHEFKMATNEEAIAMADKLLKDLD